MVEELYILIIVYGQVISARNLTYSDEQNDPWPS